MKLLRYLRDALVFAPCYVLLDWVSYIDPLGPFNITPWNPQPALAIAWMLLAGLAHAPAVYASIFLADAIIRGVPAGPGVTALTALVLTAGYAAIAAALRTLLRPTPTLHSLGQLTAFTAVVVPATALIAAGFVGVLYAAGLLPKAAVLAGWMRFWIGDAVGVLVTAPLLLVAADPAHRRSLAGLGGRGETYLQIALLAAALWLIFAGLGGEPSHHFYLLFLPLIWIAVRSGMGGAIVAVAIVQVGVVLGIHRSAQTLPVIELQSLVAALSLTALYLGVMVDERARATADLRHTLRLAAAGDMAGAIAHELNQPLTALTNYGKAALMLCSRADAQQQVPEVIRKMLGEAERASEVVRRLRDFFRSGTTRLEHLPAEELAALVYRVGRQVIGARPVELELANDAGLPDLYVDRMQIELVIRNLMVNAVEALGEDSASKKRIRVSVGRHGTDQLRLVFADSGPGLGAEMAERVFEPFVSAKPTGMGLGLAISRAIAEAHGGTLDAHAGSHGEFHLVLPVGDWRG
jgi:two-component system, LuxR family, sensor kinase FixL